MIVPNDGTPPATRRSAEKSDSRPLSPLQPLVTRHPSPVTPMPTPPSSYSAAAAEKLRLALLALAASAAVVASAQDVPDDDPADTDVLGEIPEDIEEGGVYVCIPCEKKSCASDDCMCDGPCEEGKPCTDCDDEDPGDDPGIDEDPGDDPEPPEETSGDDPAVFVGGEAPTVPAPEPVIRGEAPRMPVRCSTNAPALPPLPIELTEADLKKLEAAGFDVSTAIHAATNAAARARGATNAPAVRLPYRTDGLFFPVPRTNP